MIRKFKIGFRPITAIRDIDPCSFAPVITFVDDISGKKFATKYIMGPRNFATIQDNKYVIDALTEELIIANMI